MENSKQPIYPLRVDRKMSIKGLGDFPIDPIQFSGLTKREYFAAMAMQGILANPDLKTGVQERVEQSVKVADELLKQLGNE